MRIKWETPYEEWIVVHTDIKFPITSGEIGHRRLYRERKLSQSHRILVKSILAIHGVEFVRTHGYAIHIVKGVVFKWDELKPLIEKFIRQYEEKEVGNLDQNYLGKIII